MVSGKRPAISRALIVLGVFIYLIAGAEICRAGLFWGPDTAVTVNGVKYTTADVETWWWNWREKDMSFPVTAEPFINWKLMAREAEKMGLYQEPSFRHKMGVFLKVRSLLRYKYDKIGSRIDISDDMLREYYRENYLPRLELAGLFFNDEEKAKEAARLIEEEGTDLRGYAEARSEEAKDAFHFEQRSTRVNELNDEWRSVVAELKEGGISAPFSWREGYVIVELKERMGEDPQDFKRLRERMTEKLRKRQERKLTAELIKDLKEKYDVKVDQDLLERIDLESDNEDILDGKLISLGGEDYTVKVFLGQVAKQQRMIRKYHMPEEKPDALKKRVLNGIISQTLISRASLDENYQEREPLKPIYEFYRDNRLIKELEKRLFIPETKVSEEEVGAYYQDNIDRFSSPETVTLTLIQDEEKLVDKMYGEIKMGLTFQEVADKYYAARPPKKKMGFDQLDNEVKNILNDMAVGEVSRPFELNGHHAFLKLENRTPAEPMPLEHVRKKIDSILKDKKFEEARRNFLAALKSRSEITVNEGVWEKIRKKIGTTDVEKEN